MAKKTEAPVEQQAEKVAEVATETPVEPVVEDKPYSITFPSGVTLPNDKLVAKSAADAVKAYCEKHGIWSLPVQPMVGEG